MDRFSTFIPKTALVSALSAVAHHAVSECAWSGEVKQRASWLELEPRAELPKEGNCWPAFLAGEVSPSSSPPLSASSSSPSSPSPPALQLPAAGADLVCPGSTEGTKWQTHPGDWTLVMGHVCSVSWSQLSCVAACVWDVPAVLPHSRTRSSQVHF